MNSGDYKEYIELLNKLSLKEKWFFNELDNAISDLLIHRILTPNELLKCDKRLMQQLRKAAGK